MNRLKRHVALQSAGQMDCVQTKTIRVSVCARALVSRLAAGDVAKFRFGFVLVALQMLGVLIAPAGIRAHQASVGLYIENDAVAETDRYATHATRLDYQFPLNACPRALGWVRRLLPGGDGRDAVTALFLSQQVYTPDAIEAVDPPETDRPYGGWLRVGVQATVFRDRCRADSISISVGGIGPISGAERFQVIVHDLIGSPKPQGWGTQLPNEVTFDARFERRWKPHSADPRGWGWECIPYAGGNAGTVFVLARAGLLLRAGWKIPVDFGVGPSRPIGVRGLDGSMPAPRWAFHLFALCEARYVWHDVFLDGSFFHRSRSVEKEPWGADLMLGLQGTLLRDISLMVAFVNRNAEFVGQPADHRFGVMSLGYWF